MNNKIDVSKKKKILQYLNKVYVSYLQRHFYFEIQNFNITSFLDRQKLQNLIEVSLWVRQ